MSVSEENPIPQPNTGDDLPDWLRELRGDTPPQKNPEPSASPVKPEASAEETDDLPDWLRDSAVEAEQEQEEPSLPAAEAEPDADGEALWQQILAEEGISLSDVGEERPEGADDMSVADWMAATADESAKRQAKALAAPPPAVEAEAAETVAAEADLEPADDGMVETDDLPDWLRADQAVAATETPAWLPDESVAAEAEVEAAETVEAEVEVEPEDDGMVETDDLPDWLRADQAVAATETPAWLLDESVAAGAVEAEAAETVEAEVEVGPADDGMVETDDLPDWLRDEQPVAEAETPAWLLDESVTAETVEAEVEVEPADDGIVETDDLPDWLRDDQPATEMEAETSTWPADDSILEADVEAAEEIMEEEPLSAVESRDDSFNEADFMDSEGLPDWMLEGEMSARQEAEPGPEEDVAPAEPASAEAEPVAESDVVDTEGLPDWLKEAEAAEAPLDDEQIPSWLAETAREQGIGDIIDIEAEADNVEIPEWLQMTSGAETPAEAEAPEEAEVGSLPVWLDEPPAELVEPIDEETVGDEQYQSPESETPVWIKQLRHEESSTPEAMETLESIEPEAVEPAVDGVAEVAEVVLLPAETISEDLGEISAPADKLAIAQAAFNADDVDEALAVLRSLVEDSESLSRVIDLLQQRAEAHTDNANLFELLGDAQMRDGQLNQALHTYKQALGIL